MTLTDFIFLRRDSETLDAETAAFVRHARKQRRPVVAMTFSSMPVGERKMLEAAVAVCDQCFAPAPPDQERHRPSFIALVAGQGHDPVPAGSQLEAHVERLVKAKRLLVLRRGACFGELFPQLDAAILHGGLGVTSEALLAGIPMIISGILLLDQRYWAGRVSELGCGPPGVYIDELLTPSQASCLAAAGSSSPAKPRVVELLQKALDRREEEEARGDGSDAPQAWRRRAKEVRAELLEGHRDGTPDGIMLNARAVHEAGTSATHLRAAYAQHRGCARSVARQALCCVRFLECFLRCLLCSQVATLLKVQLRCARAFLCCRCCRPWRHQYCNRRRCCCARCRPSSDVPSFEAHSRSLSRNLSWDPFPPAAPTPVSQAASGGAAGAASASAV